MTTVRSNVYSGEHKVRQDVVDILVEHEYGDVVYTLKDQGGKRTVTIKATKDLENPQGSLFNPNPDQHPDEV